MSGAVWGITKSLSSLWWGAYIGDIGIKTIASTRVGDWYTGTTPAPAGWRNTLSIELQAGQYLLLDTQSPPRESPYHYVFPAYAPTPSYVSARREQEIADYYFSDTPFQGGIEIPADFLNSGSVLYLAETSPTTITIPIPAIQFVELPWTYETSSTQSITNAFTDVLTLDGAVHRLITKGAQTTYSFDFTLDTLKAKEVWPIMQRLAKDSSVFEFLIAPPDFSVVPLLLYGSGPELRRKQLNIWSMNVKGTVSKWK